MAVFNAAKREIDIKIVYYGPALCGKTTNVQCVHKMLSPTQRGDIMSLATKDDRTLFFDFLPIELGDVKGFKTRFHVYTVPGQVYYALTRRAVLTGVDGVVFVADSQGSKMEENIESLQDLNENLNYYKKDLSSIPFVMQYNKRDMDKILPVDELNQKLNPDNVPYFAASAVDGTGVIETLTACCKLVLKQMDSSGSAKKRRRQRQEESSAPLAPPQIQPPAPPIIPAPAAFAPSFNFDDDDGPVIKIITGDDSSSPPQSKAAPSGLSFPGTDTLPGFKKDFQTISGTVSLDDMPSMDSPSTGKSSYSSKAAPTVPEDNESIPSFDAFESTASPASLSFDNPGFDDFDYQQRSFDSVPESGSYDTGSSAAPSQLTPPSPPPSNQTGPFPGLLKIVECGTPVKISDTTMQMPVQLKNAQTGQICTVKITLAFDDFSTQ